VDYNFYIKDVLRIDESLRKELEELAQNTTLDPKTSYFKPGRHPGMHSGGFMFTNASKPILRLRDVMGEIFPVETSINYLVNKLEPGGLIREHSDATGGPQSRGWCINTQHLIHISITGNASYFFRRSLELDPIELKMKNGLVYPLNNYVYHYVTNPGNVDRFNIIFYYNDPQWEIKKALYKRFNIISNDY